jgi:hypothetical protein
MKGKRAMAWTAAAAFCALLIGWLVLQPDAAPAIGEHPHNKANHHPKLGHGPTD